MVSAYSPDSDPYFAQPYIDKDEMRDAPVRHRYVHGGFRGTDTRFSFYFPAKAQYQAPLLPICDPGARARGTANSAWQAFLGPNGTKLPVALQLESVPGKEPTGVELLIAAANKRLPLQRLQGDIVILGGGLLGNIGPVADVKVGDEVTLDNSNFLAAQTYHRHQVPGPEYHAWDQFRGADGKPIYPQRPMLLGPLFTKATSGTVNTGKFTGKMILVENLQDIDALPWQGDWYRQRAAETFGPKLEDHLRLWYTERANHGDTSMPGSATHVVSYLGVLQQALRDVSAWVEKGVPPAPTTKYRIVDAQVVVPATAAARRGIQPVIDLKANGGARAEAATGQSVRFSATIEVPPAAGKIVSADWDLDGTGAFATSAQIVPATKVTLTNARAFSAPGTYFVTLRVASQRQGDAATPYARIKNLARVRVIVR